MEVVYDRSVDAAYLYLVTVIDNGQIKKSYSCDTKVVNGQITMGFDSLGRLLGIEILNASRFLPEALLRKATVIE